MNNRTKIRIALTSVTILFLILIGYLIYLNYLDYDYEWTVRAFIIEDFDQIFAFFGTFTISSYNAFFVTILSFGILILPFVINELGILDDHPNKQLEDLKEEGQSIEEAEDQLDRFAGFLKRRFGPIKKIKNYTLPIGITLTILGGCLMVLPSRFLIDSPLTWNFKTETWIVKEYYGFIRGQLLLIGISLLIIGLIVIGLYIHRRPYSAGTEK